MASWFKHEMNWLRQEIKKPPNIILVMVDKKSQQSKSLLKSRLEKCSCTRNQVNFLKKLEGFQNITWTWDTVYKLRMWYKLPLLYGYIKTHKSFVKVYWGWKSTSTFISKLPHFFPIKEEKLGALIPSPTSRETFSLNQSLLLGAAAKYLLLSFPIFSVFTTLILLLRAAMI